MTKVEIDKDDTVALEARLPTDGRDYTGASVEFIFDEQSYSAVFKDKSKGDVAVPISSFSPNPGYHEIQWKVTYSDGTVEHFPPDDDDLQVYE